MRIQEMNSGELLDIADLRRLLQQVFSDPCWRGSYTASGLRDIEEEVYNRISDLEMYINFLKQELRKYKGDMAFGT